MATKKTKDQRALEYLQRALQEGHIDDGFINDIWMLLNSGAPQAPEFMLDLVKFLDVCKSKEEQEWSIQGAIMVESWFGSKPLFQGYEWLSFKLPGANYTPDFSYLLKDGRWVHIEVKGSKYQHEYNYSRARLRATAALNPWFIFAQATRQGRSHLWEIEVIKPDEFLGSIDFGVDDGDT